MRTPSAALLRRSSALGSRARAYSSAGTTALSSFSRDFSSVGAPALPSSARVVVVGGGIIGTSVAYHLAKMGWTDTLLVERDQVTSGTTWHAAGLMVTFGSLSETSTEFRKYAKQLYSTVLEEETGQSTGFMPCGFIELATDEGYLEEFRRVRAPTSAGPTPVPIPRSPSAGPTKPECCFHVANGSRATTSWDSLEPRVHTGLGVQSQVRRRRRGDLGV